tara:strand:- start:1176 stop:1469 length:294 start_codon:yes stop_codon:yes gene_type:complete
MPLQSAFPLLEQDILIALMNMKESADVTHGEQKSDEQTILEAFAKELATAIHNYTLSAQVITTVTTAVVGTAGPIAPVPMMGPALGVGTGAGNGNLL